MKSRKFLRTIERLAQAHINSVSYTGSGHLRLRFSDCEVVVSSTPSCPHAAKHVLADIKRQRKGMK